MNLLVVSYCFLPWLAPRAIQESRILGAIAARGHSVTIIQRQVDEVRVPIDMELASQIHPSIKAIEISEPKNFMAKIARNVLGKLGNIPDTANIWAWEASRTALRLVAGHSAMITFSSPVSDHLVGLIVKLNSRHMPWAAFFSDPFIDNPYLTMSPAEYKLNSLLEKYIIKYADAVIFVNECTRERIKSRSPLSWHKKLHVIPHAFDDKLFPPVKPDQSEILTIRYMGDFYGKRTPEILFKALSLVSKITDKFKLEIFGAMDNKMLSLAAHHGLSSMVIHKGRVPYLQNLSLMKTADALITIDAPGMSSLFLPSKLIDYLGARRPILAVTPPSSPTALIMHELGWPCHTHDDTMGIANSLLTFIAQKTKGALDVPLSESVLDRFRVQTVTDQYIKVLGEIVNL